MKEYKAHELSDIIPSMTDEEYPNSHFLKIANLLDQETHMLLSIILSLQN